jgi:hypothetical protein
MRDWNAQSWQSWRPSGTSRGATWESKCRPRRSSLLGALEPATASASKATIRSKRIFCQGAASRSGGDLRFAHGVIGAGLPEHLTCPSAVRAAKPIFLSGPQGARLARLAGEGRINIGAIPTYIELFARYFIDLTPRVALIAAQAADHQGNLYTGANTEDTPAIVEATAFKNGVVIAQVNEVVVLAAGRHPGRLGGFLRAKPGTSLH